MLLLIQDSARGNRINTALIASAMQVVARKIFATIPANQHDDDPWPTYRPERHILTGGQNVSGAAENTNAVPPSAVPMTSPMPADR